MKTQEILSIVALGLLGVCLLCGLAKMAMKGDKAKKSCDHVCSLSFFVAVVLLGVSQLLTEEGYWQCESVPQVPNRINFSCIEEDACLKFNSKAATSTFKAELKKTQKPKDAFQKAMDAGNAGNPTDVYGTKIECEEPCFSEYKKYGGSRMKCWNGACNSSQ